MHRGLLLLLLFIGQLFLAQSQSDCFLKLEKAFTERGANPVPDAMHKNVVICFFNKERMGCFAGKVRVEGGKITRLEVSPLSRRSDIVLPEGWSLPPQ